MTLAYEVLARSCGLPAWGRPAARLPSTSSGPEFIEGSSPKSGRPYRLVDAIAVRPEEVKGGGIKPKRDRLAQLQALGFDHAREQRHFVHQYGHDLLVALGVHIINDPGHNAAAGP